MSERLSVDPTVLNLNPDFLSKKMIESINMLEGKKPEEQKVYINGGDFIHTYIVDGKKIEITYPQKIDGLEIFVKVTLFGESYLESENFILTLNGRDLLNSKGVVVISGEVLTQLRNEVVYLANGDRTISYLPGTTFATVEATKKEVDGIM